MLIVSVLIKYFFCINASYVSVKIKLETCDTSLSVINFIEYSVGRIR